MTDFLTEPGFLGTRATLRSDLTLVLTLVTAVLFNLGFILAKRKRFDTHHRIQTTSVVLNSLVVVISMVTSYINNILPGIPGKLGQGDYAVISIHGIIGAVAFVLGLLILVRCNEKVPQRIRLQKYKPIMRWSYGVYMLATLSGIGIYYIVFILGI